MKKLICIAFFLTEVGLFAQEVESIVTDRPTQSASAATVGKNKLLIESGFIFENTTSSVQYLNFNTLFRYGVSNRIEVRVLGNFDRIEGDDFTNSSLGTTGIGTKIFLLGSDKAFADISLIGQVNLPTGENNDDTTGELRFNFANQLSDVFSLGYNLGVLASPDRENELSPFYSIVLGAGLGKGWTVFAEPYGFFSGPSDHRFNTGIIYLATPTFQVDLTGGIGLSEDAPNSFIAFGAAIGF